MKKPPSSSPPPPAPPSSEDTLPQLLTPKQLAGRLQMSLPTLRRYVLSGEIPSVQIGKRVRFDPADIRQFIKNQKGKPKL